jgi:hypothetical protein
MVWVYDHTQSLFIAYVMHASIDFFLLISVTNAMIGINLVNRDILWAAILWIIAAIVVLKNTK